MMPVGVGHDDSAPPRAVDVQPDPVPAFEQIQSPQAPRGPPSNFSSRLWFRVHASKYLSDACNAPPWLRGLAWQVWVSFKHAQLSSAHGTYACTVCRCRGAPGAGQWLIWIPLPLYRNVQ